MLPYGMSIEGLGLRSPALMGTARTTMAPVAMAGAMAPAPAARPGPMMRMLAEELSAKGSQPGAQAKSRGMLGRALGTLFGTGRVTTTQTDLVRGRIVKRDGKTIVIDIEVLATLEWDEAALAAATARLELEDGTFVGAKVVLEQSTRTARLLPGQHAKLVLMLDRELPYPARFVRFEPDFGLYIPLT